MAISSDEYWLIDLETGRVFNAATTVIVPEVFGGAAYDVYYDDELAIEYADAQGIELDLPDGEGIPVTQLESEPRGYLAIDADNGNTADPSSLVLVARTDQEAELLDPDDAIDMARASGLVPLISVDVLELEGLPFESVVE